MNNGTYYLSVKIGFSAAHFLRGYQGKCSNLHGHSWVAECTIMGEKLNSLGMLMDFHHLEDIVSKITDEFDHCLINDHPSFREGGFNPTAENLAYYIYVELQKALEKLTEEIQVCKVTVWESEEAYATYRRYEK